MIGQHTTALPFRARFFLKSVALAAALSASTAGTAAQANVTVSGPADAVQVVARASSVAEVLTALCTAFKFHCRTSVSLDRPVSGTFSGPVRNVIARLLANYNYIVKVSAADRLEVIVLRSGAKTPENVTELRPPIRPRTGP